MKIFEIGVLKTGTTSLGRAFEILGFNHQGCSFIAMDEYHKSTEFKTHEGYWWKRPPDKTIFDMIDKYDSFEDNPWRNIDYEILDRRYPNSKFIILERDDESWIRSLEYFCSPVAKLNKGWENWDEWNKRIIDRRWETDRENLIREKIEWKHQKYSMIKEYFKDRTNNLLVMNICAGEGWEILCPFLNKQTPDVQFPKLNVWASDMENPNPNPLVDSRNPIPTG
tara:strand:+ start:1391 stop:2062 length:672 start_codon:yes stop_codon:yes gene_type:complete